jgi:hypothetical protein
MKKRLKKRLTKTLLIYYAKCSDSFLATNGSAIGTPTKKLSPLSEKAAKMFFHFLQYLLTINFK